MRRIAIAFAIVHACPNMMQARSCPRSNEEYQRRLAIAHDGNPLSPPAAPVQGRLQGPPAKSKFLAVAALAGTLAEKHPLFGDRSCELTLIGHERDLEVFGNEMLQCFCTGQEIEHWQSGGDFPDPWPANLKQMG